MNCFSYKSCTDEYAERDKSVKKLSLYSSFSWKLSWSCKNQQNQWTKQKIDIVGQKPIKYVNKQAVFPFSWFHIS